MNPHTTDENWARWIFASVSDFFDKRRQKVKFYVEGTDMKGRRKDEDYIEFRFNGPMFKEVSGGYWEIDFDVNLLVCSIKDEKNFHKLHQNVGIASKMFDASIPIRCMGNGPDDDPDEVLECAILETEGRNGGLSIQHYGQFDPNLPVLQSTVEGSYKLYLTRGAINVQQNES